MCNAVCINVFSNFIVYLNREEPRTEETVMTSLFGEMFDVENATVQRNTILNNVRLVEEQLQQYRREQAGVNCDPLQWWKDKSSAYDMLVTIAKMVLSVSGTSVPSERLFSAAGNVLNAKRSCLSSENVDMLLFLNKNI